jgi:hypothetical protein
VKSRPAATRLLAFVEPMQAKLVVLLSAPFPNHIIFDTETRQASWHTSSREWIPEEGFSIICY